MKTKYILFSTIIVGIITLYFVFVEAQGQIEKIKNEKYTIVAQSLKDQVNNLISDKQNSTLALAIALSRNQNIIDIIHNKAEPTDIHKELLGDLGIQTEYKNIWIHILDAKGTSLYRSWSEKRGDNLYNIRDDIKETILTNQLQNHISVGIFSMSFKSIVPVFERNQLIGIIEFISHFNSISKKLEKDSISSIVLVDKRFEKMLSNSITNTFIDGYYLANLENNPKCVNLLENIGIENLLKVKDYTIYENTIVTYRDIVGANGAVLGYFVLFKNLDNIQKADIVGFESLLTLFIVMVFISALILLFLITNQEKANIIKQNLKKTNELNKKLNEQIEIITQEKNLNKEILDAEQNFIVLSDGKSVITGNKTAYRIIKTKEPLEEFYKYKRCICDYFLEMDDEDYIYNKLLNGKNWIDYILENKNKQHKCAINIDSKIHHYKVFVKPFNYYEKNVFIVVLSDITYEMEITRQLKQEIEVNKKKDVLIQQQSRLAILGEMIGNIAHQWRQPLSMITVAISSLKLKKDFGNLEESDIDFTTEEIMRSANFLSKTIEDFRNFFKKDKQRELFYIDEVISNTYNIIKASYVNNNIVMDYSNVEKIEYDGFPSELSQVFLNIFTNAKEILVAKNIDKKYVRVSVKKLESIIQISILDNGGGVDNKIIEKIFDPYFSTKHQSMGTGLGLYMSTLIIKRSFKGNLYIKNEEFIYEGKAYKGANFIIELPLENTNHTKEKSNE